MLETGKDYRIGYFNCFYDVKFFNLTSFAGLNFLYVYSYRARGNVFLPALPEMVLIELDEMKYDPALVGDAVEETAFPQRGVFNDCHTVQDIIGKFQPVDVDRNGVTKEVLDD
jgi:hypothetical protein